MDTPPTNGHAPRFNFLEARRQLQRSEHRRLLERYSRWDDDWSCADLWRETRVHYWDVPGSQPSDKAGGKNYPIWSTEKDLDRIRQKARIVCDTNARAIGLRENLINHIAGKPFQYKWLSKENTADSDPDKAGREAAIKKLIAKVQDELDRAWKWNRWNGKAHPRAPIGQSREQEILGRLLRDGEVFLRYYVTDGQLTIRFIEPEQIRNPLGESYLDGWTFGILCNPRDPEEVQAYHIVWQDLVLVNLGAKVDPEGEEVDASEIDHFKGPRTDATIRRGVSAFAFGVAASLERARILEKNVSVAAQVKAAIAETWQHAHGTESEVSTFRSGVADHTEDYTKGDGTTATRNVDVRESGIVRDIPLGMEAVYPAPDNSAIYLQVIQSELRAACSAFCAPEIFTGDASNGTYAGLKEASAPFVKYAESYQLYLGAVFARVAWKAIEVAVEAGRLPREALTMLDLQVEGPTVYQRDRLQVAQEAQIYNMLGVWSPQTIAMETGKDYEVEAKNIEQHRERFGDMGTPLGMPGADGALPGMPGLTPGLQDDAGGALHEGRDGQPAAPFGSLVEGAGTCGVGQNPQRDGCVAATDAGGSDPTSASPEDSKKVLRQSAKEWTAKLEDDEKEAIVDYTLDSDTVNSALRSGTLSHWKTKEQVEFIDSALAKSSLSSDATVYRGLPRGVEPDLDDAGYVSASIGRHGAEEFAGEDGSILKINLPKWSRAAYIAGLSPSYASEGEVLMPRNSRFEIARKYRDGARTVYELTLTRGHQESRLSEAAGTCKPGETAKATGCVPASGDVPAGKATATPDRATLAAQVDALPRVPGRDPDTRDHGFAVDLDPPYRGITREEDLAKAPVLDVPLKDLTATQAGVSRQFLAQKIDAPQDKPVLVVRAGGKQYLHDGTHQATLARLAGRESVRAKVLDYDPELRRPVAARESVQEAAGTCKPGQTAKATEAECAPGCACEHCRAKQGQPLLETEGILNVPDSRQSDSWSCGAAVVTSIAQFFGVEPNTEPEAVLALGSSPRDGTDPERIVAVLQGAGLETTALSGMDLETVEYFLSKGRPVICCIQAWGESPIQEAAGTCKPGETAAKTGCVPGSDSGSSPTKEPGERGEFIRRPDGLPEPDTLPAQIHVARSLRGSMMQASGGSPKDQCINAAHALHSVYPETEIWSGKYGDGEYHTVAKLGGRFIDVTADQFGGPKVVVRRELPDKKAGGRSEYWSRSYLNAGPGGADSEVVKKMADGLRSRLVRPALVRSKAEEGLSEGVVVELEDGHYVIVIGIDAESVIVMDPARFSPDELAGYGTSLGGQRVAIPREEFVRRWRDQDGEGNTYERYGVSVRGPADPGAA